MSPLDVFAEFSEEPLASASIAQVHRARLKPGPGETEGRIVAVKVQKPAIKKQMELDLFSYRYGILPVQYERSADHEILDVACREAV
jgi:aarF domain-containing kinase